MNANATNRADRRQDKVVEDTFPASDPPANSGVTGAGGDSKPAPDRSSWDVPTGYPTSDRHNTETAHQSADENTPE